LRNYRRERGIEALEADDDAIRSAIRADNAGFGRSRLPPRDALQRAFAPISAS